MCELPHFPAHVADLRLRQPAGEAAEERVVDLLRAVANFPSNFLNLTPPTWTGNHPQERTVSLSVLEADAPWRNGSHEGPGSWG